MTESEVIAVHRDIFYKALLTQDYTALAKLYLDDYVLVRPNGSVLSKQQVLEDFRETGLQFTAIDLIAEKVRIYGTTAIITGESRTEFVRGGTLHTDLFFMTAIYIQTPGGPKLAHFQSTPRAASSGAKGLTLGYIESLHLTKAPALSGRI